VVTGVKWVPLFRSVLLTYRHSSALSFQAERYGTHRERTETILEWRLRFHRLDRAAFARASVRAPVEAQEGHPALQHYRLALGWSLQPASVSRALRLRCDSAAFVRPRLAASSIAASIWQSGRSRSATLCLTTADKRRWLCHAVQRLQQRHRFAHARSITAQKVDEFNASAAWPLAAGRLGCTARLSAIAAGVERIKDKSFMIDGKAVVLGPDGMSRFEELRLRSAARTPMILRVRPYRGRGSARSLVFRPQGGAGATTV
jgi:hypothetical protein